ncbi:MAG TPA: hypothetical protein VFL91_08435 [Thermomicrobiales bacterium]|nr:hypothetical protein [Thermomicrobiales bacterium]
MGWQGDDDLVTRTIANWHGGRLPVGAGQGATMDAASEPGPTSAARAPMTDAEWDASIWRSLAGLRDWPPLEIDYHTVSAALDERIALRAAVARLEGERDAARDAFDRNERARDVLRDGVNHLARDLVAATAERDEARAERDAARAALAALISDAEIAWHDYHNLARHTGRREGCDLEICRGLRRAVARARAATGRGE